MVSLDRRLVPLGYQMMQIAGHWVPADQMVSPGPVRTHGDTLAADLCLHIPKPMT